jgi:hypothetical protein
MKTNVTIMLVALTSLVAGCSTTPVAVAPVGPNPVGITTGPGQGQLEVFSAVRGRVEGDNPTWYQHTGYYIYNRQGKRLKHVANTVGYYAQAPRVITLPAGQYLVKAQAKDYLWVEVPVIIDPGRTTRVHLDDAWQTPPGTPKTELVSLPAGHPVGWRANTVKTD